MAKNGFMVAIFAGALLVPSALSVKAERMEVAKGTDQIIPRSIVVVEVEDDDDEDCRTVTTTDGSGRTITETVCE